MAVTTADDRSSAAAMGRGVAILRWPAEAHQREVLLAGGRPCLWILDEWELPPAPGPLEDWVRLPIDERDLHARVQRLAGRTSESSGLDPGEVHVDASGRLVHRGQRILVPPMEARILNRLAETPQQVVTRSELAELAWGDQARTARALDSRIHVLRTRVAAVGLAIHTIRGHGFLLAVAPAAST